MHSGRDIVEGSSCQPSSSLDWQAQNSDHPPSNSYEEIALTSLALSCANSFAQDNPINSQFLLGDILIYKGYQAAGNNHEKIFAHLSSSGISGESFLASEKKLSVDQQIALYLAGKILIIPHGEAAMSFRQAFSQPKKEIKKRLNFLSHDDLISIFQAYRIPSTSWGSLEKQI